jgi:prepilin-type N-terminal cleavage/methylation domain-containing protein
MNKRTNGFSLIEVVISITILALIIALFSYSITNQTPKYQLKRAAWEIYSRLNYARYKAIFRGTKYKVRFEENSYALEIFDEQKSEWKSEQQSFLDGVQVTANNSPIFHPRGTVSNMATIIIRNSRGGYTISIAISGRIKVREM